MKLKHAILLAVFFSSASLFADQFAWVSHNVAEKAVEVLSDNREVALFCAPCNDTSPKFVSFEKVKIVKQGSAEEDYYSISIDGQEIDLAYTYVQDGETWRNLARMIGLDPKGVPDQLPDSDDSQDENEEGS